MAPFVNKRTLARRKVARRRKITHPSVNTIRPAVITISNHDTAFTDTSTRDSPPNIHDQEEAENNSIHSESTDTDMVHLDGPSITAEDVNNSIHDEVNIDTGIDHLDGSPITTPREVQDDVLSTVFRDVPAAPEVLDLQDCYSKLMKLNVVSYEYSPNEINRIWFLRLYFRYRLKGLTMRGAARRCISFLEHPAIETELPSTRSIERWGTFFLKHRSVPPDTVAVHSRKPKVLGDPDSYQRAYDYFRNLPPSQRTVQKLKQFVERNITIRDVNTGAISSPTISISTCRRYIKNWGISLS